MHFPLLFARLLVPLNKVLTLEKAQINLAFARLIVPLNKVLTFEKAQINLAFCSLNRTFAPQKEMNI